ncbi:MAG: hypothetical protein AAGF79_01905 [Pseudomonadota bacterium]
MELTEATLNNGIWEGVLTGAATDGAAPQLQVTWLDRPVEGVEVVAAPDSPGCWRVRVPVPSEAVADGVQTFVISTLESGARLASFSLIAGAPAADDIRVEIELLRAELDMLKRAFRRHCLETS